MSDTEELTNDEFFDRLRMSSSQYPVDVFDCYERFLKWRFTGAHHTAVTPKALESATDEFWRFWDRARSNGRAPTPVSTAAKTHRDLVTRKDLAKPTKAPTRDPPPKPRKRLVPAADRARPNGPMKKARARLFMDDEAEEVSHRRAQAEDDANTSEDEGSLKQFVVDDDEQDAQGSSPLL